MADKTCVICLARTANENAPILTMGGYGNAKYLCDKCAEDLDTVTRGREYGKIVEAMDRISAELSAKNVEDKVAVTTVKELLEEGAKRAKLIKEGSYDFALDDEESEEDVLEEIPEELRETEEDRELDRKEAEALKKFDKVTNWLWLGILVGVIGAIVYFFFIK